VGTTGGADVEVTASKKSEEFIFFKLMMLRDETG
jgi:hypothetical protein